MCTMPRVRGRSGSVLALLTCLVVLSGLAACSSPAPAAPPAPTASAGPATAGANGAAPAPSAVPQSPGAPAEAAPAAPADAALRRRAGLASTLLAGLELAREGQVLLRQDAAFGPILLRRADAQAMAAE